MKDSKTKNVVLVDQAVVRDLLVEALQARGFDVMGAVKVDFVGRADGTTAVLVENMRRPEDKPTTGGGGRVQSTPRKFKARISNQRVREIVHQYLFREGLEAGEQVIADYAVDILWDHGEIPRGDDRRGHQQRLVPRVRFALEDMRADGEVDMVEGEETYWVAVQAVEEPQPSPGRRRAKAKKTVEEIARDVVARVEDDRVLEETRRVLSRLGEGTSQGVTYGVLMSLKEVVDVSQKAFGHALGALRPRVETALAQLTQKGEAELDAHEEDGDEAHWRVVRGKLKGRRFDASAAVTQRASIDFVDGKPIERGVPCVWISDVGITVTHPDDWPEGLWEEYGMLDEDRLLFAEVPRKEQSESDVAADVLGGDGGVLGRGDALESGLGE